MKQSTMTCRNCPLGMRLAAMFGGVATTFWLAAGLGWLAPAPASAAERQMLPKRLPASLAGLRPVGSLAATSNLDLTIALPLRDPAKLHALLSDLYDPASPRFRQFLSPEEFVARFAPREEDYQALKAFARANRLAIVEEHPNRTLLHVRGAVADVERTFQVKLRVYPHPAERRNFYAADTPPSIDLAVPILDIRGLDNFELPHPAFKMATRNTGSRAAAQTGSGIWGSFMGQDFRSAYAPGVTLDGTGQAVALFEMDGYYTNDIAAYESQAGLPNVALTNILLGGCDGTPHVSDAVTEVSLDIEMAMAMAPGLARVMVYEAPQTSAGAYDILNRMATDNQAKQISSSWVIDRMVTNPVSSQIYQQFAAQGQSFFQASGDQGAYYSGTYQTADNPFITIVGGTTLTTTGPGGAWVSETVWNWENGYATGGGISSVFAIPTYQQGIDMSASQGSTMMRNVPDVALTADNVEVIANGLPFAVGGTSCAAPLWAGFMAIVNQQTAANGLAPIGFLNPAIYALGRQTGYSLGLHDITAGDNGIPNTPLIFQAVPGYDLCTGWGTPTGSNLINALVAPAGSLQISPGLGFAASGPTGGPLTPASQTYSLKNTGTSPLNWSLVTTSAWLSVSATGGQLAPGGLPGAVTVGLNAAASNLMAGTYTAAVLFTNLNDRSVQSRQFVLQMGDVPVAITAQPASQSVPAGGPASFSVGASGSRLSYYWQKNNTNLANGSRISGASTSTLTIADVALADAGFYSVIVSNAAGSVTGAIVSLVVERTGGSQLVQNGGFEAGDFSAWTLSGNTNVMAVTTNAFAVHSGNYGAEVGSAGSLGFISQTLATVPGTGYLVSVWLNSPDGKVPNEFVVQWNGNTIFDAANLGAMGWTNLQFIANATGASTVLALGCRNDPAYLGLDEVSVMAITDTAIPPSFTRQPRGQEVTGGATAVLSVAAAGSSPLSYQWRLNGNNLSDGGRVSGATTPQLTISNVSAADVGSYSVVASNVYGMVASLEAGPAVPPPEARVVTFDDLPETPTGQSVTNGYYGLNWNSFSELDGVAYPDISGPSGYSAAVISTNNVVYNDYGGPASFSGVAPFNLYSAFLTAVWNDGLQVQVLGYSASNHLTYSNTFTLSATAPTLVQFNCSNVIEVDFVSSGGTAHPGFGGTPASHFAMDNLAFSFVGPVLITRQPAGGVMAAGTTATLSVAAIGATPLTYQWRKNGVDLSDGGYLSGAATSALTLSNLAGADAGIYSVVVSNACGPVTSDNAVLSIYSIAPTNLVQNGGFETGDFAGWSRSGATDATFVTNQPAAHSGAFGAELGAMNQSDLSQSVPTVPGATYRLALWLKNLPPGADYNYFRVQWNGQQLCEEWGLDSGDWKPLEYLVTATGSSATLEFVFENHESSYALDDVGLNVVTSFSSPPVITNQPIGRTACWGDTATYSVAASGTPPLGYQWRLNGTNLVDGGGIAGSAAATLIVGDISGAKVGTYSVLVTNAFGSAVSSGALLTLLPDGATVIIFDDLPDTPNGWTITNGYAGLDWTNLAVIDGANAWYYQPGAAAGAVSKPNVVYGSSASAISSPSGSFTLFSAYLTAPSNGSYSLAVLGYAGGTLLYSNYCTLTDTAPSLVIFNYSNITQAAFVPDMGSPFLLDDLALSFNGPVVIGVQPAALSVFTGQPAAISVRATGSLPLTYQWLKNGVPFNNSGNVSGATNATLSLAAAGLADAGVYSVIVSNSYGPVSSAGAALTVTSLGTANLIQNGGFETGDFTGWTPSANTKSTYITTNAAYVHSGRYGAQLGPYGSYGELDKTIPTTAGATYLLSFSWANPPPTDYNCFNVYWNGNAVFNSYDLGAFGWTNLQFLVSASDVTATLQLSFENDMGYFGLDDVCLLEVTNVASPPALAGQPSPQLQPPGATATFSVTASGSAPLAYQWRLNGTNLAEGANVSGSTSNYLTLGNVSSDSVGIYSVVVTNAYGSVTSAGAALSLLSPGRQCITFDELPDSYYGMLVTNGYAGLNWDNIGEVNGVASYYYQPGSQTGMISASNVAFASGIATIASTNMLFTFLSAYFTAANDTNHPLQVLGYSGVTLLYSNSYYLSTAAPTLMTPNYTNVSHVQLDMSGSTWVMDNLIISTTPFTVPFITTNPVAQSARLGDTATFSAAALGAPALGYQWLFNGTRLNDGGNIQGAATSQLTVSNASADNIGAYSVVVTNGCGSATSTVAMLALFTPDTNNLVQNGGFETGDFTAWSLSGDPKNIGVDANTFYVHSGQFGAQFGSYNATYLSQTIPTSPGTSYVLSFWLDPDGQGSVGVAWDGQYRLWWAVLGATGWTNLQYDVTATQTNTPLQFMLQDAPAYLGLDDVRVTQYVLVSPKTATPVQMLAPQVSHGNLGFGFQTVPGQSYTIQQATNLAFPNWVTCTNFTGTGAPYLFTVPAAGAQPQIFFRVKEP